MSDRKLVVVDEEVSAARRKRVQIFQDTNQLLNHIAAEIPQAGRGKKSRHVWKDF